MNESFIVNFRVIDAEIIVDAILSPKDQTDGAAIALALRHLPNRDMRCIKLTVEDDTTTEDVVLMMSVMSQESLRNLYRTAGRLDRSILATRRIVMSQRR